MGDAWFATLMGEGIFRGTELKLDKGQRKTTVVVVVVVKRKHLLLGTNISIAFSGVKDKYLVNSTTLFSTLSSCFLLSSYKNATLSFFVSELTYVSVANETNSVIQQPNKVNSFQFSRKC